MLNFWNCPKQFKCSSNKVTYALSYLCSTALDYFEPDIVEADGDNPSSWLDDYEEFSSMFKTLFGPFDPVSDAGTHIESLQMETNQQITKYVVEFMQLVSQLKWGDSMLAHHFYQGFPDCIKDKMKHAPKVRTLHQIQQLAHPIDAQYWEWKEEIAQENAIINWAKSNNPSLSSKSCNPTSKSNSKKPLNSLPKKPSNFASTSSNSGLSCKVPDLSGKLGKDGKLTSEERQCHLDNGLCMCCGAKGHMAKDCPHSKFSSSSQTKGHVAKVEKEKDKDKDDNSESKK